MYKRQTYINSRFSCNIHIIKKNFTTVRFVNSCKKVKNSSFSGTVRSDKAIKPVSYTHLIVAAVAVKFIKYDDSSAQAKCKGAVEYLKANYNPDAVVLFTTCLLYTSRCV